MLRALENSPSLRALLRGVSRSFYVSIRLMPAGLERPIAVAYLLARATDTIADTARLPAAQRQEQLQDLAAVIEGTIPAQATLSRLAASFVPLQEDPQERDLILALPHCLAWLERLNPADQNDVRETLRH